MNKTEQHMAVLNWPNTRLEIGSQGDNGEHIRGAAGWPYSIYRHSDEIGRGDTVICDGIQNLNDAGIILAALELRQDILTRAKTEART